MLNLPHSDLLECRGTVSDIIPDAFGGSGTTLNAAHRSGCTAWLIEYDPCYVDTIIRRYENVTGKRATLISTGETFEDVADGSLMDIEVAL